MSRFHSQIYVNATCNVNYISVGRRTETAPVLLLMAKQRQMFGNPGQMSHEVDTALFHDDRQHGSPTLPADFLAPLDGNGLDDETLLLRLSNFRPRRAQRDDERTGLAGSQDAATAGPDHVDLGASRGDFESDVSC